MFTAKLGRPKTFANIDHGGNASSKFSQELFHIINEQIVENPDSDFLSKISSMRKVRVILSQELFNYLLQFMMSQPLSYVDEGPNRFWASIDDAHLGLFYENGIFQLRIELSEDGQIRPIKHDESSFIENPISAAIANFRYVASQYTRELSLQVKGKANDALRADDMRKKSALPENPREYSPEAWLLFRQLGNERFPFEATFDKQRFILSEKYQDGNVSVIGMVQLGGVYHMRLFYYSNSGGNWHCTPGIIKGNLKSKGHLVRSDSSDILNMSYENGTVVDDRIAEVLEKIPLGNSEFPDLTGGKTYGASGKLSDGWQHAGTPLVEPEINDYILADMRRDGISVTPLIHDTREFALIFREGTFAHEGNQDEYSHTFMGLTLPDGFLENLKYLGKGKEWNHHILHTKVESEIFETIFQGKIVHIEYARAYDSPENGWIENIYFPDSTLSSWGFRREQIHAGILRTKPLEYQHQCPAFIQQSGIKYGNYIDIRPYTQINPLIEALKKFLPR